MTLSFSLILALISTSLITVVSQTLFKHTTSIVTVPAGASFIQKLTAYFLTPTFLVALVLYGLAFVIWIWLLSKDSLSILYPLGLSLNVIFALVSASLFLGETITVHQIVGIGIIILGIFVVAR